MGVLEGAADGTAEYSVGGVRTGADITVTKRNAWIPSALAKEIRLF